MGQGPVRSRVPAVSGDLMCACMERNGSKIAESGSETGRKYPDTPEVRSGAEVTRGTLRTGLFAR